MGIFTRELDQFYACRLNGKAPALDELSVQMSDVARWQRDRMQGDELERHLAYWKGKVGSGLPVLALPGDHPRPPVASFRGQHQAVIVPAPLSDELRVLARRHGVTTFMTLMAAFLAVLHQRTGQEDIVIGSAIADRDRPQLEDIIGFLVNMLVLRTDLSGNPAFPELLRRVRDTTLGAYTHKDLPLTRLVREAQPERDLSRMPLFQVEFSLLTPEENPAMYGYGLGTGVTQASELLGLPATTFPLHYNNARYDIAVFLWDLPTGITGTLEYSSDLFEPATIRTLVEDFVLALKFVAEQPLATLDRLVSELTAVEASRRTEVEDRYRASMSSKLASLRRRKPGQSGG
jgi:non-ribosomal peptide synthetase component F